MEKVNILIIGGSGFIGNSFITNIDRTQYETIVSIDTNDHSLYDDVIFYQIDVNTKPNLQKIIKKHKISTILYLADNSTLSKCQNIDTKLFRILNFLTEEKIRIIYVSSCVVYDMRQDVEHTEESVTNPSSIYSLNKIINENIILYYHKTYNLDYIILRPTNIYGKNDTNSRLIPNIIQNIKQDTLFSLKDNSTIDFIYVQDFVFLLDIFSKELVYNNKIYNVSTGINTPTLEILKQIESINKNFKYQIQDKSLVKLSKISNKKIFEIYKKYNFSLTTIEDGIAKTIKNI